MSDPKAVNPPTLVLTNIPVSSIVIDHEFNARQKGDGEGARPTKVATDTPGITGNGTDLDTLTENIKKHGMLSPVLLRPVDPSKHGGKTHFLVAGFRRMTVAQRLNWTSVPANVREMSDAEAYLFNLIENVQREDLSPGEIADRAIFLRDEHEMSGASIANSVKLAPSYLNNIMRMADFLMPWVWKMARTGRDPKCPPQNVLLKMAGLTVGEGDKKKPDTVAQTKVLNEWRRVLSWPEVDEDGKVVATSAGAGEGGEGDGGGGAETPANRPARTHKAPSKEALDELRKLAQKAQKDPALRKKIDGKSADFCAGIEAACVYAIGKLVRGKAPEAPIAEPEETPPADAATGN